jgi:type I restriction enzyme, S subunit
MSKNLPSGWVLRSIGQLGRLSTSSVDKKNDSSEKVVNLLNYMDVYRNNFIRKSMPFMRVTASDREISSFTVKKGDVFFTPSSETPDDIGHSAVVLDEVANTLQSYHLMRLRFNNETEVEKLFRGWIFREESVYSQFRVRATGSTRFTLSLSDVAEVTVSFPESVKEQQKIAKILTSVDEVIENTQSQINKLEDLKKATMNELLTKGIGHTEFKETEIGRIPRDWRVLKIAEIGEIVTGMTPDTSKKEFYGSTHFFVSPSDINEEIYVEKTERKLSELGFNQTRKIPKGSVLVEGVLNFV